MKSICCCRNCLLLIWQAGVVLGLRGAVAFEVEARTVDHDLHSGGIALNEQKIPVFPYESKMDSVACIFGLGERV
jgi:hypothetical protein